MKYENPSSVQAGAIAVSRTSQSGWYPRHGKRAFDLALAIVLLPLLTPVIAVLWLMARSDGGPGFYGHGRIGRRGVPFKCWKVRSMVLDADERLCALLQTDPAARAQWDRDQKLDNDPRITRFGHFMRRTSLDELPQIFNVIKGDMSFVGPRPVVQDELERYGAYKGKYLSLKPGITGLWQVSGRNDCTYDERVRFDAEYAKTVRLHTDVMLIVSTAKTVVYGTGK
ncbi:MAG: sugar transferase [Pseudomonadota bacterium]